MYREKKPAHHFFSIFIIVYKLLNSDPCIALIQMCVGLLVNITGYAPVDYKQTLFVPFYILLFIIKQTSTELIN
jgi:hypothetical protein